MTRRQIFFELCEAKGISEDTQARMVDPRKVSPAMARMLDEEIPREREAVVRLACEEGFALAHGLQPPTVRQVLTMVGLAQGFEPDMIIQTLSAAFQKDVLNRRVGGEITILKELAEAFWQKHAAQN